MGEKDEECCPLNIITFSSFLHRLKLILIKVVLMKMFELFILVLSVVVQKEKTKWFELSWAEHSFFLNKLIIIIIYLFCKLGFLLMMKVSALGIEKQ